MFASLSFELLKLRKRPAVWVLGMVLVLVVIVFDYYSFYSAIRSLEQGGEDPTRQISDVGEFKSYLLPTSLTVNVAGLLAQFGGPIALILGALAAGGEYGWGTLKTGLTQGPGRLAVFSGKLMAVGAVLVVYALLALGAGAAGSSVVAGLLGEPVGWPPVVKLFLGLGVIWLVLGAWAAVGLFLATLLRGTAMAIGLGLVYGLAIEGLILGFSESNRFMEAFAHVLLVRNAGELANALGDVPRAFVSPDPVDPAQAALVLTGYVVCLLLVAALVFGRRDVA